MKLQPMVHVMADPFVDPVWSMPHVNKINLCIRYIRIYMIIRLYQVFLLAYTNHTLNIFLIWAKVGGSGLHMNNS